MKDPFGQTLPYFEPEVYNAIYYCKDRRLIDMERDLGIETGNVTNVHSPPVIKDRSTPKRNLCVFLPVSYRVPGTIELATAVLETWADENTFFVNPANVEVPAGPLAARTITLANDIDTNYAQLPLRTYMILNSLGTDPRWRDECRWYMKGDLDSYLSLPRIAERLQCFDPNQDYYMGSVSVMLSVWTRPKLCCGSPVLYRSTFEK